MSKIEQATPVTIRPYGKGSYFNGCYPKKVSTIVELQPDLTARFIDVLDAKDKDGNVDSKTLHERVSPIGEAIGATLREKLAEHHPVPLCRKGAMKNCGLDAGLGFSPIVFIDDDGSLEPHISTHIECADALMPRVESNAAAAAPMEVENASPRLQFDLGCFTQMGAAAELAGQLMVAELEKLEAIQQAQA